MIITYEFDTADEKFEPWELRQVQKANDMALALWRLQELVLEWDRHPDNLPTLTSDELVDRFYKVLEGLNINLNELVV